MNHLQRCLWGRQAFYVKPGSFQSPLCLSASSFLFRWLSTSACTLEDSVGGTTRAGVFRDEYLRRFGEEPSLRTCKIISHKHKSDYVAQQLDNFIVAFGKSNTKAILRMAPQRFTQDVAVLDKRLAHIRNQFGWSKEEGALALSKSCGSISLTTDRNSKWCEQVTALLKITNAELGRVVLKSPYLLEHSVDNIVGKVSSIRTAFDGCPGNVDKVIVHCHAMLRWKEGAISSKVADFVHELHLFPYDPRQVLLTRPFLMTSSHATLMDKVRIVMSGCRNDPEWMESLQSLKPSILGDYLCEGKKAFPRLQYYQSCPKTVKWVFGYILKMPEAKFDAAYPGYQEWLKQNAVQTEGAKDLS